MSVRLLLTLWTVCPAGVEWLVGRLGLPAPRSRHMDGVAATSRNTFARAYIRSVVMVMVVVGGFWCRCSYSCCCCSRRWSFFRFGVQLLPVREASDCIELDWVWSSSSHRLFLSDAVLLFLCWQCFLGCPNGWMRLLLVLVLVVVVDLWNVCQLGQTTTKKPN